MTRNLTEMGISREIIMGVGGLSSQVASAHDNMGKVGGEDGGSIADRKDDAVRSLADLLARNPGSEQVLYRLQGVQPKTTSTQEAQPSNRT